MLTRLSRSFIQKGPRPLWACARLQSTQSQQPQSTVSSDTQAEFLDELKHEMDKLGPLSDSELQELEAFAGHHDEFTVFPKIHEVKPEEVVGFVPFGKNTYFVQRSATGNLPVYTDYKNGNKLVTEIRKIQGDPVQLRNDLQERLPFIAKKYWKVSIYSKKIFIQGDATKHVKKVLATTF
ncbi:54S ribosomal protein IMG2 [Kluyveromyces marxianus]|nr:hypothetical protein C6P43_002857 [Kluyveromyces marxianus]KAG0685311.1 hypothetical protein C6P41_000405 [Kluyveromyces marxianus]